ncbi:peptidase S14 [Halopseudomonas laoshanensis]|uniref:Peptidase S14 n=1 Tax=Halopseudomonas laoshanensis TaxID=2268758 RepID=A0A7V7KWT7_9GAMM|nr:ATP-dependent Clp protease proteolytic subunit [Halopseudomonas laoshanensis]KAA0696865.1 peptidase S14 [Halopseudomonas laoshanensis]
MPDSKRHAQLASPHIRLSGTVDQDMYDSFRQQLDGCSATGPIIVAITTLGGDPEVARTMGDDVRLLREQKGREMIFLGKVAVYSAGATFMSSFPVECRFLTETTWLMIHERQMHKKLLVDGPLRTCVAALKATLHEIEHSISIEEEGFRAIIKGLKVNFKTIRDRAPENWYIDSNEALELGLVHAVI